MCTPLRSAAVGVVALACHLVALVAPVVAAPRADGPAYWAFHSLARGAASRRLLGLPAGPPRSLVLADAAAYRSFWTKTHRCSDTYVPAGLRPPRARFNGAMVVVIFGRPGSADVRVQKMWTLPGQRLAAGVFNPVWPDVAMDPDRVPYEMVLARATPRHVIPYERPSAQALWALTQRALTGMAVPEGPGAPLSDARLDALRQAYAQRGRDLLTRLDRLPRARSGDADEPYATLLRGAITARFLDRPDDARHLFQRVANSWPGSTPGRFASSRLQMLARRTRDEAARRCLDETRRTLLSTSTVTEGHARRWTELGQAYEYLTSQAPLTLFLAARCYIEAARDASDADRVQNGLLQAASIYEQELDLATAENLYWECVKRYPDALSVGRSLVRLASIGRERGRPHAEQAVYRTFLKYCPRARIAPEIRNALRPARP